MNDVIKRNALAIKTLGGVEIRHGGELVTSLVSRKAEALLIYLVYTRRTWPRETLATLLWADLAQTSALANLSVVLSNLRKQLPGYVKTTRHTVTLNENSDCWLDTAELEAQLHAWHNQYPSHTTFSQTAIQDLEAVLDLYRGDFLAGFHLRDGCHDFEEWALLERERLQRLAIEGLTAVVTFYARSKAYQPGIRQARRLIELDPLREDAHRQMMLMLARSGERNAALVQYERCRDILAQELGVAPAPEITTLYERIRATKSAHHHNLPAQVTPFVGREAELVQIAERLADPECRLLTLVGSGGIGKTRLALQAAQAQIEAFLNGVYYIPLVATNSPEYLAPAIAEAIDFAFQGHESPQQQLWAHLENREMLLVLDNFEHLLAGAAFLVELLHQAPEIKLLVTSRERLNLRPEWILDVHGLMYPESTAAIEETFSAGQLFWQNASRLQPDFTLTAAEQRAIIRICQLLDGMPLGIELASAWVRTCSCQQIAAEIERNLDFLTTTTRDVPRRHRSLRAVFDQSWQLLTAEEQDVLCRLSVFRGGFQLGAAVAVAGASRPLLASLADKSLIRVLASGRYDMHELLRQYAEEKLVASQAQKVVEEAHGHYFTQLMHEKKTHWSAKQQHDALQETRREIDNIRAAWEWALLNQSEPDIEKATWSLCRFYEIENRFQEGVEAFTRAATVLSGEAGGAKLPGMALGKVQRALGQLLYHQGLFTAATDALERGVEIFRQHGDLHQLGTTLNLLGLIAMRVGNYTNAKALYQESLTIKKQVGTPVNVAVALNNLGDVAKALGEYEEAKVYFQESLTIKREIGHQFGIAVTLANLGEIAYIQGNHTQARSYCQESLTIFSHIGDRGNIAFCTNVLGAIAYGQGEFEKAIQYHQESLDNFQEIDGRWGIAKSFVYLGRAFLALDDMPAANRHFAAALRIAQEADIPPLILEALFGFAQLFARQGEATNALELLTFILGDPTKDKELQERAERLYSQLETTPSEKTAAQMHATGKADDLAAVIEKLSAFKALL